MYHNGPIDDADLEGFSAGLRELIQRLAEGPGR